MTITGSPYCPDRRRSIFMYILVRSIRDGILLREQHLCRVMYNIIVNTRICIHSITYSYFMSQLWGMPRTGTRNNSLGSIMTSSSARIAFLGMCRSFFHCTCASTKNHEYEHCGDVRLPRSCHIPTTSAILGLFLAFCDIVSADGVFRQGGRSITDAVVECLS